ncbi:unnamed protein product [Adineta ricciae]|uniref:Uncharacterized protein n=1 Tax=Adineta ricciae TaxID=249248 RepID=A0A814KDR0_ADIRI|nr:unnamed protein product [Adineta ricciae]CAF1276214.1 unnamed protein product [Adineta ricciae]
MDLLHAAECGCLSVVKTFLTNDKSVIHSCRHRDRHNHAFNVGGSAIHYASRSGHLNIVKYLLEHDATIIDDRDRQNWTALHYACYNGHIHIVKFLLKYNPNVNIKDKYFSQTAVQFAMYRQFHEIVKLFNVTSNENVEDVSKAKNIPIFRKKSNLFLGRYKLTENQIKQIELFRGNLHCDDIELRQIEDVELFNLSVRILFTHNFNEHINRTMEISANEDENDPFLRSSSTSAFEHILVFKEEENIFE